MRVSEAIIVEGTNDKIKIQSLVDALVVTTDGFDLFRNREKMEYIKKLAQKTGIVVFTDSDRAGFLIRSYIKSCVTEGVVKHAYTPSIEGKERRKRSPSREGLLGVEGMDREVIINALKGAGCVFDGDDLKSPGTRKITKADFFEDGLCGGKNSTENRRRLARALSLPGRISANALLDALNTLVSYDEYKQLIKKVVKP